MNIEGMLPAYFVTEGHQHIGIFWIVSDLHVGDKGQLLVGETLSKVVRDKDPGALIPWHICSQDHLKEGVESLSTR